MTQMTRADRERAAEHIKFGGSVLVPGIGLISDVRKLPVVAGDFSETDEMSEREKELMRQIEELRAMVPSPNFNNKSTEGEALPGISDKEQSGREEAEYDAWKRTGFGVQPTEKEPGEDVSPESVSRREAGLIVNNPMNPSEDRPSISPLKTEISQTDVQNPPNYTAEQLRAILLPETVATTPVPEPTPNENVSGTGGTASPPETPTVTPGSPQEGQTAPDGLQPIGTENAPQNEGETEKVSEGPKRKGTSPQA